MSPIEEKLTTVFQDVFTDKSIVISREMTAKDVDNWTSITHAEMLTKVENVFGIKFTLKEIRKFKNVGDLIDSITNRP